MLALIGRPVVRRFAPAARHAGFMAIEAFAMLGVLALGLVLLGIQQFNATRAVVARAAAEHLRVFHQASESYVRANYAALVTATAGAPVSINVATLVAAGHLHPSVLATGFPNPYGQTPVAWVRTVVCAPTACPNRLELVTISTGGRQLSRQDALDVAVRANGAGTNAAYYGKSAPATLRRVYGAGTVALAAYAPLGLPTTGRAGAVSFFDGSQLSSDYLARVNTGNPEDNRMRTTLDMTGQQIVNGGDFVANDLQLSGKGGQWASAAIANAAVLASGQSIAKPSCPHGAPAIYTSVVNAAADAAGTLWSAVQTWAVDGGAAWTVNIRVRTAVGWVTPADGYGNVLALVKCE